MGRGIDDVLQLPPPVMESIQSDLRLKGSRRHEFQYKSGNGRGDLEIGLTATHLETPGGRAGLQIITIRDEDFENYRMRADFIQKYIFPGGMLPSEARLKAVTTKAGLAWTGIARFGQDYADTLAEAGVAAGEALFVGDTWGPDVEGPTAAGIRAVYLRRDGHWRRGGPH